jgi:hypothetical protein
MTSLCAATGRQVTAREPTKVLPEFLQSPLISYRHSKPSTDSYSGGKRNNKRSSYWMNLSRVCAHWVSLLRDRGADYHQEIVIEHMFAHKPDGIPALTYGQWSLMQVGVSVVCEAWVESTLRHRLRVAWTT